MLCVVRAPWGGEMVLGARCPARHRGGFGGIERGGMLLYILVRLRMHIAIKYISTVTISCGIHMPK